MTLLERINLLLLKVQQLRLSQEHERHQCQRHVTTDATLEEGVKRVPKSYQPRVEQEQDERE
jgi:hypothetical protein